MLQFQEKQRNVIKKETEMILKYKDCTKEIQHMSTVHTKVIPVIVWATGTISTVPEHHTWKARN